MKKQKFFIFDDRGQSKKIPHIPFVSVFSVFFLFSITTFLIHKTNPIWPFTTIIIDAAKFYALFWQTEKKETIKKKITKTKFGLETNKDEMYYSVFENGSRKKSQYFLNDFQRLRMRKRKSLLLYQIQIKRLSTI